MKNLILKLLFSAALLSSTALAADAVAPEAKTAAPGATPAGRAETAAPVPAPDMQPPVPKAKQDRAPGKKQIRSKSLDLRYCLDLETNAAIIKCAGE